MARDTGACKKEIPFGAQVCLILFCGIVLSAATFCLVRSRPVDESALTAEMHKVTFAYQDGTVIETRKVRDGSGVFPPTFETEGIFRGWNSTINNVMSDMETHPMVYQISSDDENLFYFDSVYVLEGEEFKIDLMLGGWVNISTATLNIEYDSEVMDYVGSEDSDVCDITMLEAGTIVMDMKSDPPLREKTLLSELTFLAKEKDVCSTQITLSYKDAKLTSNGMEYPATVSTINNEIYYLQEVE